MTLIQNHDTPLHCMNVKHTIRAFPDKQTRKQKRESVLQSKTSLDRTHVDVRKHVAKMQKKKKSFLLLLSIFLLLFLKQCKYTFKIHKLVYPGMINQHNTEEQYHKMFEENFMA